MRLREIIADRRDGGFFVCFASDGHIVFRASESIYASPAGCGGEPEDTGMTSGGDVFSGMAEAQNALLWKH